jgi:N-acetylglucosamine kinase-like BadF-type ATPase
LIYAGIDAGGSSCKCLVINEKKETLASIETGPANYQVVGFTSALIEVQKAVVQACNEAGIDFIDIMGIGMAGAGRETDIRKIKEKLLPLEKVKQAYITDDARIALMGAHGGRPGMVVIAGTGSIVYALTTEGKIIRAGGWGPLLGDEGSGFWLGLKGIKAIIMAREGRGMNTSLEKPLLNKLDINQVEELVGFIHHSPLPRKEVATLAPLIVEEMLKGDRVAKELINEGLRELALTIRAVARKLKEENNRVAATGGLFSSSEIYRLFSEMMANDYGLIVVKPRYPAVYGAVLYGMLKAGKNISKWEFNVK